jgi:hypothetical protein
MTTYLRWTATADAAMNLADEQQYALTAATSLGPWPPAQLRNAWAGTPGDLPFKCLGSFTADGPITGAFAVAQATPAGKLSIAYGSGTAMLGHWLLFLLELGSGGPPSHGPWPWSGGLPGLTQLFATNAPLGAISFSPQTSAPGRIRDLAYPLAYSLGYANDAFPLGPVPPPPWSSCDGDGSRTQGGTGIQALSNPINGLLPLVAGHRYALMAVPFASSGFPGFNTDWASVFPRATLPPGISDYRACTRLGGGYEDSPSYGHDPNDHWTVPSLLPTSAFIPFGWPVYDPPQPPLGWPFTIGHTGTVIIPPNPPPAAQHIRTGQRLHLEAYGITVQLVGDSPGPILSGGGAGGSSSDLLILAAAGAVIAGGALLTRRKRKGSRRR